MKGSATLGNTYTASLEQSGAHLFWALAALTNCCIYSADATNAFAKVLPPIAPLCVTIDKSYWNWYYKYRKLGNIPSNYVLPVKQAL